MGKSQPWEKVREGDGQRKGKGRYGKNFESKCAAGSASKKIKKKVRKKDTGLKQKNLH